MMSVNRQRRPSNANQSNDVPSCLRYPACTSYYFLACVTQRIRLMASLPAYDRSAALLQVPSFQVSSRDLRSVRIGERMGGGGRERKKVFFSRVVVSSCRPCAVVEERFSLLARLVFRGRSGLNVFPRRRDVIVEKGLLLSTVVFSVVIVEGRSSQPSYFPWPPGAERPPGVKPPRQRCQLVCNVRGCQECIATIWCL